MSAFNKAFEGLGQFCQNWCMNVEETQKQEEPIFRCKQCEFQQCDGTCTIKKFLNSHCKSNKSKYTAMS